MSIMFWNPCHILSIKRAKYNMLEFGRYGKSNRKTGEQAILDPEDRNTMSQLQAYSYLAPNLFWFYEAICAAFGRALNRPFHLEASAFDPLEDPTLLVDAVDVAFMCGLPFNLRNKSQPGQFAVLGAPVPQLTRYQD